MKTLIKHSQYFLGTFKKGLENLGPASFNSRNAQSVRPPKYFWGIRLSSEKIHIIREVYWELCQTYNKMNVLESESR